jgi:hypothetical protein
MATAWPLAPPPWRTIWTTTTVVVTIATSWHSDLNWRLRRRRVRAEMWRGRGAGGTAQFILCRCAVLAAMR